MTKEENLQWLDVEIRTWESECRGKYPIKEALYAARKALEQEPCEDAVSRDDVVRIVQHNNPPKALEKIRKLSSVTPQEQKWIPVSEKLPKPFTFVNATCRSLVDDRENWVIETVYMPIPKEVNKHGYSDWGNIPMLNWGEAEVIAWVERIIPQPYKAESEG